MEARGEPEQGQRAVAHVIWNRLKDGRWGQTLAAVCLAPEQFSCWNERDPNRMKMAVLGEQDPVILKLADLFASAFGEVDPTDGAMWYYAPKGVILPPYWAAEKTFTGVFGSQRFYR